MMAEVMDTDRFRLLPLAEGWHGSATDIATDIPTEYVVREDAAVFPGQTT